MRLFDPHEWESKIADPLWYIDLPEIIDNIELLRFSHPEQFRAQKNALYSFFDENLQAGKITLGTDGTHWNKERKPIDTIVIHHTSYADMSLTKERLSAIELVRLYATSYAKHSAKEPIYSDHIRDGKQVFYPYHWIIRKNGSERLLNDNEIGWHAGNWETNRRSIAIAIDDDHLDGVPSDEVLRMIADLIKDTYPRVSKKRIFGHREVNPKTTCPGNHFLSAPNSALPSEGKGWKERLLDMI